MLPQKAFAWTKNSSFLPQRLPISTSLLLLSARRALLSGSFLCVGLGISHAQNVSDALRFSYFEYGGTARFNAVGGSMSALGADLSTTGTNPAGIGWFQKSEYTISLGVMGANTQSLLLDASDNSATDASRGNLNLQNLGMVFTSRPQAGKWKTANFAITFNHLANFNRAFAFSGATLGSITQRYQEIANGSAGLDDYESSLASNASAIYDIDEDGTFDIDYEIPQKPPLLRKEQDGFSKGSMSEFSFALGVNYDDRVLIGASVGVPFFTFTSDKTYVETDDPAIAKGGAIPYFSSLALREQLTTLGGGVNAKLGIIVRPHQNLRLGASIHTPTNMTLNDSYDTNLEYIYFEDATEQGRKLTGNASAPGNFEYGLRTPWRIQGGLGVLLGKFGFVSADLEFVDYGKARFSYTGYESAQENVNSAIRSQLGDVLNVRFGGELVLDVFRLRAGVNRLPSPFLNDDSSRFAFTAGTGVRLRSFYLDLSYRRVSQDERYYPYVSDAAPVQEVLQESRIGTLGMTTGFKF